ncbi:hypothetical protein [Staphylococcus americanisciuri]|uniref:Uncharacterized protein n=1 Tax=Staphylococcus americanisciuri TaxID=2973940 RepID=A0ABT2F308_9STAP|nr:hypothetical protein [Staphylococcus americanisciuri]MCS4486848.1 hypothetical protein [Staphylococcus americanisciuri]
MVTILTIVLIVSLVESMYLLTNVWNLKRRQAPDSEYEALVNKYAPIGIVTVALSVVILVIAYIIQMI